MVNLSGITWDHPRGRGGLDAATADWQQTHPGIQVTWEARSLEAFGDETLEQFVMDYDLLVIDHPHIPHSVGLGLLADVRVHVKRPEIAAFEQDSLGSCLDSYRYGDGLWALPIDAAAQVAAYRSDLLPDPPLSWDDVLQFAARTPLLWPMRPADAISSFISLAGGIGSAVARTPGRFADPSAAEEVLSIMHRLAAACPDWCLSADPIRVLDAMSTTNTWAYAPLLFGYTNYSRRGFRPHLLAFLDVPAGAGGALRSCLGGAGIAVSAATRHVAEATAYAAWLASPTVQAGPYFRGGGQPASASAWSDPSLDGECQSFFRATSETLRSAIVRPRLMAWPHFQNTAGQLLNRALRGEMRDDRCIAAIEAAYARCVAGEGASHGTG